MIEWRKTVFYFDRHFFKFSLGTFSYLLNVNDIKNCSTVFPLWCFTYVRSHWSANQNASLSASFLKPLKDTFVFINKNRCKNKIFNARIQFQYWAKFRRLWRQSIADDVIIVGTWTRKRIFATNGCTSNICIWYVQTVYIHFTVTVHAFH